MLRRLPSFAFYSCYSLLLLSLIFGTGRQALALHAPVPTSQFSSDTDNTTEALHQEKTEKNSSQPSLQAVPLISLLLPQNTYNDTMLSSKRLLSSRALLLHDFTQFPYQHHRANLSVRHSPSRARLLALQKLRLEGG